MLAYNLMSERNLVVFVSFDSVAGVKKRFIWLFSVIIIPLCGSKLCIWTIV